jgi:hypothetical protein
MIVAQPALQVVQIGGQTQDRHDLRGHRDVEAGLPGKAVGHPAQPHDVVAQGAVVHVHHPAPADAALVDLQLVAPVDVVVDHRREQVVGAGDGVEIAGEVEVHLLHRHHLRVSAAGRAALHAEAGAEAGLADADRGLAADAVQPVAQPHGGGGLALARRRRVDGGDQDQLALCACLPAMR